MRTAAAMLIGFVLDCLLGDPAELPHPVCLIGRGISFFEKIYRQIFPKTPQGERQAGFAMLLTVLLLTGGISWGILLLAGNLHPILHFLISCVFCWQIPAAKCLRDEALKVQRCLEAGSLQDARTQISMLVGRDTAQLSAEAVTRAAIETVAENTSDGVIAPLFWIMLFGPIGGFLYKAINTMDSMVGYKNDRYLHFGRYPAKLDDLVNWIPARLSALLMIAAAALGGYDEKNALRIWKRDRKKHASPNSAQTESVCAGALHIRLAGNASYFGKVYEKPYIGDPLEKIGTDHIGKSCKLMYMTSVICLLVFGAVRLFLVR